MISSKISIIFSSCKYSKYTADFKNSINSSALQFFISKIKLLKTSLNFITFIEVLNSVNFILNNKAYNNIILLSKLFSFPKYSILL